jgi:hypothetical protein
MMIPGVVRAQDYPAPAMYGPPEHVLVENAWSEGPRAGLAQVNGQPHRFVPRWDDGDDEDGSICRGTFLLWRSMQTRLRWSRRSGASSWTGTISARRDTSMSTAIRRSRGRTHSAMRSSENSPPAGHRFRRLRGAPGRGSHGASSPDAMPYPARTIGFAGNGFELPDSIRRDSIRWAVRRVHAARLLQPPRAQGSTSRRRAASSSSTSSWFARRSLRRSAGRVEAASSHGPMTMSSTSMPRASSSGGQSRRSIAVRVLDRDGTPGEPSAGCAARRRAGRRLRHRRSSGVRA